MVKVMKLMEKTNNINVFNGVEPKHVNKQHVMKVVVLCHHQRRKRMVEKCQKQVVMKIMEKTNKKAELHLKRVIQNQNFMSVISSLH